MNLSIKIDPGQVIPTLQKIGTELTNVETKGERVGPAISKGMNAGADSMTKIRQALTPIADQFAATGKGITGLNDMLSRQTAILDRIHGPIREYEADMRVLSELYQRDAVTAAEYTAEVNRLDAALAKHQRSASDSYAPAKPDALGDASKTSHGLLDAAASYVAPAALAATALSKLDEQYERWERLKKSEVDASNALLKFYDNGAQANAAMEQQKQLATDLHSKLDVVVPAYAAVREATEDLYLSTQQQIDVTRNLSAIMVTDGKSIGDVASVMDRLHYAMNLGNLEFRDLKAIAKEYPDLMDVWTKTTGKTVRELEDLAKQGKIDHDMIGTMVAGIGNADSAMDKFGQRTLTIKQAMEDMDLSAQQAYMVVATGSKTFQEAFEHQSEIESKLLTVKDAVERQTNAWRKLYDETEKRAFRTTLEDIGSLISALPALSQKLGGIAQQLGLMHDAWGDKDSNPLLRAFGMANENAKGLAEAKEKLAALSMEMKAGGLNANAYRSQYEQLMTTLNGGKLPDAIKLMHEVNDPLEQWTDRMASLNAELNHGLDVRQYNDQLRKLIDSVKDASNLPPLPSFVGPHTYNDPSSMLRGIKVAVGYDQSFAGPASVNQQRSLADMGLGVDLKEQSRDLQQLFDKMDLYKEKVAALKAEYDITPYEKYRDELAKIEAVKAQISDEDYRRYQGRAEVKYLEEVAQQIETNNQKYDAWMHKQHSVDAAFNDGLESIKKKMMDVSGTVTTAFDDVFSKMEDGLMGGATTWSSFADSAVSAIERIILKLAEMEAAKALSSLFDTSGGGGGSGPGTMDEGQFLGMLAGEFGGGASAASARHVVFNLQSQAGAVGVGGSQATATSAPTAVARTSPVHVQVNDHRDPRDLINTMDSRDGHKVFVDIARKNAGALRALLK